MAQYSFYARAVIRKNVINSIKEYKQTRKEKESVEAKARNGSKENRVAESFYSQKWRY